MRPPHFAPPSTYPSHSTWPCLLQVRCSFYLFFLPSMQIHFIFASPFSFLCAPTFLCIPNCTLTCTDRKLFSNVDAATVAAKRTYTQRGRGSYLVRAATCPEARVWAFLFRMLFWLTEKPVGISQEFMSDIMLWIILVEHWFFSHRDCLCLAIHQSNMYMSNLQWKG